MAQPCPCQDQQSVNAVAAAEQPPHAPPEDPMERNMRIALECYRTGEPFISIRAKDALALATMDHYQRAYHELAGYADTDFATALARLRDDFQLWRSAHTRRIKIPD